MFNRIITNELHQDLTMEAAPTSFSVYDKIKGLLKENRRVDQQFSRLMENLLLIPRDGDGGFARW